ncbi:MAG TPA: hypothetical protein VGC41_29085 [Kofleriaceae bacterium]
MKSLVLSSLLLVPACFGGERADTGECPAGETCSPLTPEGLQFVGASFTDQLSITGPSATAIGGTQTITIEKTGGDFLTFPYIADDDGGTGVKVLSTVGPKVTVTGVNSRENYLRILDQESGELLDRHMLSGAAIDTIGIVPWTTERVPESMELAFLVGDHVSIGVALTGAVQESTGPQQERLVDESMTLSLDADLWHNYAWDAIDAQISAPGTHALTVTAGTRPAATLGVVTVDRIDLVVADAANDTAIAPGASSLVCFDGIAASRYVAGLTWSFTVNGTPSTSALGNCVVASPLANQSTMTIVGNAMGMSATATIAINANARRGERPTRKLAQPAGERALSARTM